MNDAGAQHASSVSPPGGRARAWLELVRISNLPTVWSNALLGVAIAWSLRQEPGPEPGSGTAQGVAFLLAAGVGSMVYAAGMAMNDLFDARIDARERPGRPIPSGRITRRGAAILFAFLLAGAMGLSFAAGLGVVVLCAVLIACVFAYNLLHKRHPAAAVLMGLCRLLVVAIGAFAVGPVAGISGAILAPGVTLAAYIAALTLLARREVGTPARARTRAMLAWLCVVLPILGGLGFAISRGLDPLSPAALAASAVMALWLGRSARLATADRPAMIRPILGLLGGICLIDAWFLALLGGTALAGMALGFFGLTLLAHRRILGT